MDLLAVKSSEPECKGLVFRGYRSTFYSKGRLEMRQGVRLLKSKSCPGCNKCRWETDEIREAIDCNSLIMPGIKDGALYGLHAVNISKDWETGYVDAYDLEIYELEGEGR